MFTGQRYDRASPAANHVHPPSMTATKRFGRPNGINTSFLRSRNA